MDTDSTGRDWQPDELDEDGLPMTEEGIDGIPRDEDGLPLREEDIRVWIQLATLDEIDYTLLDREIEAYLAAVGPEIHMGGTTDV